jgi:hypothetical protein
MGPVSQICSTLKNPYDYVEVKSERQNSVSHFSPEHSSFANRGLRSNSSSSGLFHERAACSREQHGCPWSWRRKLKHERRTKGPCNKRPKCLRVFPVASRSIYLSSTEVKHE